MNKADCKGCYQDFYNNGAKSCWSFSTDRKKVLKIAIHKDQMPPFKEKEKAYPECYSLQQSILVDKSALDNKGYWK